MQKLFKILKVILNEKICQNAIVNCYKCAKSVVLVMLGTLKTMFLEKLWFHKGKGKKGHLLWN